MTGNQKPSTGRPIFAAPAFAFRAGSIELIKWVGVILMTIDHVNKHLYSASINWMFARGRIALPLFCVALAFNLSRPGALEGAAFRRTATRLACFGTLASVPFLLLGGLGWGWWPLNIMFTLCLGTLCAWLIAGPHPHGKALAALLALIGGAFVEFWWPALALFLLAWSYFRKPTIGKLLAWAFALLSLHAINGNAWALASVPLLVVAAVAPIHVPRIKGLFYGYYPAHLAAIWLVQRAVDTPL